MKSLKKSYLFLIGAMLLGALSGFWGNSLLLKGAEAISSLFMSFLQLLSGPIVFLSIIATLLGMKGFDEMKRLGKRVIGYTLLTTFLASFVALTLFLLVQPAKEALSLENVAPIAAEGGSYLSFLLQIVPSNLVKPFLDNHVIAIAFLAFLIGSAALMLPKENKEALHLVFSSFFKLILKITEFVIFLIPIGIWAFMTLLVKELQGDMSHFHSLILYLGCVLGANFIQGLVVLPILLKAKGLSPWKILKGGFPALFLAFFSKSSNATLPLSLKCAENNLGISPRVANFSLPLCTVINMNGCAAFILTTVLFVASSNGFTFTPFDLGLWVVLSVLAAVGNAGVPMGCFFLSSAFLIAMHAPIALLGLILPFYAFIDMVETALNVFSDITVTAIVDRDLKHKEVVLT